MLAWLVLMVPCSSGRVCTPSVLQLLRPPRCTQAGTHLDWRHIASQPVRCHTASQPVGCHVASPSTCLHQHAVAWLPRNCVHPLRIQHACTHPAGCHGVLHPLLLPPLLRQRHSAQGALVQEGRQAVRSQPRIGNLQWQQQQQRAAAEPAVEGMTPTRRSSAINYPLLLSRTCRRSGLHGVGLGWACAGGTAGAS